MRQRPLVRNQNRFFSRTLFYFVCFVFFGAVAYVAVFSPYLEITQITIEGNESIPSEKILSNLESVLSGKYFDAVSRNNLIFCQKNRMAREMLENYKKIRSVEIKKKFPSSLMINIVERRPNIAIKSGEKIFLLDENVQAYDYYDFEIHPDLLVLNDESKKEIAMYSYPLETGYARYLLDMRKSLREDLGIEIENEISTPSVISNYVRVRTKESWDIYFSLDIPLEKAIGVLGAAFSKEISDEQKKDLEYLDLRINNKVFYKLKEGSESEI